MNKQNIERKRNIIPRWRRFKETSQLGELASFNDTRKVLPFNEQELKHKYHEWNAHKTLPFAADLVASSFAVGCYEYANDAALFIIHNDSATEFAKDIARKIIMGETSSNVCSYEDRQYNRKTYGQRVKYLRSLLTADPWNSIAWTDIAHEYTNLGELAKAKRAIEIALYLTPENRFILRSACRLFHHIDDPGRALHILRKSNAVKHDPWITSAEIASSIAAGNNSGLIRLGLSMTMDKNFHPLHITELSSALGTVEIHNGDNRSSRKLFLKSLESPNDNSFAQAVWVSKIIPSLDTEEVLKNKNIPCLFEANAIKLMRIKDWDGALRETEMWLDDQPFSRYPAILGSYLATDALGDYQRAVDIAKQGLEANPNDNTILNNLSYALARLNRTQEAEMYFLRINLTDADLDTKIAWHATKGLIQFRNGHLEEGRELYKKAIGLAAGKEYKDYREAASIHWAWEEIFSNSTYANEAITFTIQECSNIKNEFNIILLERLKSLYESKKNKG